MTQLTEDDFADTLIALRRHGGRKKDTADSLGITDRQLRRRLNQAAAQDIDPEHPNKDSPFAVEHLPERGAHTWEIKSDKNNCYRFGAFGDLHAGSKYARWDVRSDLMKRAEDFGAFAILDTGNWCDGEAPFNKYDLEIIGMSQQIQLLADKYPKIKTPTYAVTGADHEGWWIKREGIDVGRYCESVMREAGHSWIDLGYIEADIILRNVNSGATSILRVAHPGGGSAYALSYKPQKIVESYEGAEKPAVVLFGHYHKLECGNVRNVWYCQTGCQCDQTPFMRQKNLESHVGGILLGLEQDPETGAITRMTPDIHRYFNRGYYFKEGKANQRWSGHGPIRQVPRGVNLPY